MTSPAATLPEIEPIEGVYVPSHDSRLLIETALGQHSLHPGTEVLDLCCGSGVVGIAAAMRGGRVDAVDADRLAVVAARRNSLLNGVQMSVRQGDLFSPVEEMRYDLILSNPPYVPTPSRGSFGRFGWSDGGPDGRFLVDRICLSVDRHLAPGGELLMVHSSLSNTERSLEMLNDSGLDAEIVAEREIPFGPISLERIDYLRECGHAGPDDDYERISVIRAVADPR